MDTTPATPSSVPAVSAAAGSSRWVRKIRITNRHGKLVSLVAPEGALMETKGLGQQLVKSILDKNFPIRITLGKDVLTPEEIRREAKDADRVLVVLQGQAAGNPGILTKNPSDELLQAAGSAGGKVIGFSIQADPALGYLGFDPKTNESLAATIVNEMSAN
jgi:hypothetical protein